MNSLTPLLTLLLLTTAATATAQLLPENLKLSQTRLQPVVPASVRIQAVAENDGLDLVVWGSSMRDGERAHPVLYFAILQDSTILVPPTRMTGLESVPNTFVQVLPLSGRWGVVWTNDTGANARSRCVLVSPDGSLGDQFELWEGHPITRHGARAVRMGSADFICWSDTGAIRTVGRWLGHTDLVPEYLIVVDTGYLYLTRDYCSSIDGGLIETSAVKFRLVKENRSIVARSRDSLGQFDSYGVDYSCRLYAARDSVLERYPTVFSIVPNLTSEVEVESFYSKAPIIRFVFGPRGEVEISTFDVYLTGGGLTSRWEMSDHRYRIDDSLQIIRDTVVYIGSHPFPGIDKGETSFLERHRQPATTDRLPDNGGTRSFVAETRYGRTGDVSRHELSFIFGGFNSIPFRNGYPYIGPMVLDHPDDAMAPPRLGRNPGNSTSVYWVDNSRRPILVREGALFDLGTIDRQPRLTRIGNRVFASWLSCAADTLLYTREILRDGSGNTYLGESSTFHFGGEGVIERNLVSYGPVTVHESKWKENGSYYFELHYLALRGGKATWLRISRDSTFDDLGGWGPGFGINGVDTLFRLAHSFYDPDEKIAWVTQFRFLDGLAVSPLTHARSFLIHETWGIIDSVQLLVPATDKGGDHANGNVGYWPIARDHYLLIARPSVFRVHVEKIVDTLTTIALIGKSGQITSAFGNLFIERIGGNKTVGMNIYDPLADSLKAIAHIGVPNDVIEGQILVRPSDSASILLYRWDGGVRTQTHDPTTDGFIVQNVTPGTVETYSPSGVFTGDTLWTVFEVKSGESYQVYLNAVIPDDGLSEVPVAGIEDSGSFQVERSGDYLFVRAPDSFSRGYLVDIPGRIIAELDAAQLRGIAPVDLSGLPIGMYMVVVCGDQCLSRRVGM